MGILSGIMEKNMENTIVYWGSIGIMEKSLEPQALNMSHVILFRMAECRIRGFVNFQNISDMMNLCRSVLRVLSIWLSPSHFENFSTYRAFDD